MGRRGERVSAEHLHPPRPLTFSSAPSLVTFPPPPVDHLAGRPSTCSFVWKVFVKCSGCWGHGSGCGACVSWGHRRRTALATQGSEAGGRGGVGVKFPFTGVREGP